MAAISHTTNNLQSLELTTGDELSYKPKAGINRITTVSVTGTGTVSIQVRHAVNDLYTLIDQLAVPLPPQTIYGVGFTEIIVTQHDEATLKVSIVEAPF